MAETSVNASGAPSSFGGGGSPTAEMADSIGALSNITKGISGVVEGIFQVISKLFNAIIDASPLLQGILKIVDKMFKLVLMPVGNLIGRILMPYVIKMARKTSEFLSKYGNAGPEQMADMLSAGLSIALESLVEMLMVVLTKVLWPIVKGLASAVYSAIKSVLSGQAFAMPSSDETAIREMIGSDLDYFLGGASAGMADIINTFGFTVQTGNRMMGNSFAESAMVFYKGNADIANGFQSTHEVMVIGTTKAIEEIDRTFNLAAAGFVEVIDTVKLPFRILVDKLNDIINTLPEVSEGEEGEKPPVIKEPKLNLGRLAAASMAAGVLGPLGVLVMTHPAVKDWMFRGSPIEPGNLPRTAKGGIVTRPTTVLAGEAGLEAIIPLNRVGQFGGPTINVNFHGDVYGMDDFERKVERTVSKYSSRVRGAY